MNVPWMISLVTAMLLSFLTLTGTARADSDMREASADSANGLILKFPDLIVQHVTTFSDHKNVVIKIKNQGGATAKAPFKVSVWKNSGPTTIYTVNQSLAPGQTLQWTHTFDQPFSAGCTVHVTVDAYDDVLELRENNNNYDACTP